MAESPGSARPQPTSTFPRDRRIRRRGEFGAVFDRGTRHHGRFFTFVVLPGAGPASRLGIVASRKIGGAVQRNRAKRVIRELFRRLVRTGAASTTVDLVVIPRRELLTADFEHAVKDFGNTWRRAVERLAANSRG